MSVGIVSGISARTGTFISLSPVAKALFFAVAVSYLVQVVSGLPGIDSGTIYSGVFDLVSIFTGFLATFYVFIATKGNKFLESIRSLKTYAVILKLVKFTAIWSMLVIALSYVIMVWNFGAFRLHGVEHAVVAFWLANLFLILINFSRCVTYFVRIAETSR